MELFVHNEGRFNRGDWFDTWFEWGTCGKAKLVASAWETKEELGVNTH